LINCSITHRCPDLSLAEQSGFNNVYDNSCWQRNCKEQLFAWQCCTCPLFPTAFRVVGLSCFPSPNYTTPTCCATTRQQGNCVTDTDSCLVRATPPSSPTTPISPSPPFPPSPTPLTQTSAVDTTRGVISLWEVIGLISVLLLSSSTSTQPHNHQPWNDDETFMYQTKKYTPYEIRKKGIEFSFLQWLTSSIVLLFVLFVEVSRSKSRKLYTLKWLFSLFKCVLCSNTLISDFWTKI
jgi:hypothetical protein